MEGTGDAAHIGSPSIERFIVGLPLPVVVGERCRPVSDGQRLECDDDHRDFLPYHPGKAHTYCDGRGESHANSQAAK